MTTPSNRCWLQGRCNCEISSRILPPRLGAIVFATDSRSPCALTSLIEALNVERSVRSVALKLNLCDYRSSGERCDDRSKLR